MASLLDISQKKKKKSTAATYYTPENTIISKIKKILMKSFHYQPEHAKIISNSFIILPNIADRSALFIAGAYALIENQSKQNLPLQLITYSTPVRYASVTATQFGIYEEQQTFRAVQNFAPSELRFRYRDIIFDESDISSDIKKAKEGTAEYVRKQLVLIEMMQELYRYVLLLLMNGILTSGSN